MLDTRTIAITGANGFVAKNLRKHLTNYHLLSFSRKKFKPLKNETAIITDYSSPKQLASKLKSCDVLIHLIGNGDRNNRFSYTNVNTNLTSIIVNAAKLAKIKQIIFLSGLGVSSTNPTDYFSSKFQAEKIIRTSNIDYTIFRPSFIIGKNDYLTKLLNNQIKKDNVLIPGDGKYVLQPISIHDVVRIIQNSFLNKKFMKKTLDLVGPDVITFENFVRLFCKKKSTKITKITLESCLQGIFTDKNSTYSIDDLNLFYGGYVGDFKKLQKVYANSLKHVKDFL